MASSLSHVCQYLASQKICPLAAKLLLAIELCGWLYLESFSVTSQPCETSFHCRASLYSSCCSSQSFRVESVNIGNQRLSGLSFAAFLDSGKMLCSRDSCDRFCRKDFGSGSALHHSIVAQTLWSAPREFNWSNPTNFYMYRQTFVSGSKEKL